MMLMWGFVVQSVIILALVYTTLMTRAHLKRLQIQLEREKSHHLFPVLILEVDPATKSLYLGNESPCFVQDIRIDDLTIELGYDFKKTLVLKFDKVPNIKPHSRVRIPFRIFEKGFEIEEDVGQTLFIHLDQAAFEMHLHLANTENARFHMILWKEKGRFLIKEIRPEISAA